MSPTGSGIISTIAGTGTKGTFGANTPATAASLNAPCGVAVDTQGNVYFADSGDNCIRMISAGSGIISTVAGSLSPFGGYFGDGGPALAALLNYPTGIAVDSLGNLYIADTNNNR